MKAHYLYLQAPFIEQQMDNYQLPKWQRVAFLAYGRLDPTGHVPFGPGELAERLGNINRETGVIAPDKHVNDYIRTAVKHGWLRGGSNARCLIVPMQVATSGVGPGEKHCAHGWMHRQW